MTGVEADVLSESVSSLIPTYEELVNVKTRATAKLKLVWSVERKDIAPSRLDELFLTGHRCPAEVSFPFIPKLHDEFDKPLSALVHTSLTFSYTK